MSEASRQLEEGLANLAIDPDVLAKELAAEQFVDPLDEINPDNSDVVHVCDAGLNWLKLAMRSVCRD